MARTAPPAFGAPPATRLHGGRILLCLGALLVLAWAGWIWLFHKGASATNVVPERGGIPGWTAAQIHYEKPEVKAEVPPPPPPSDPVPSPSQDAVLAKLRAMQAELDALKQRKPPPAPVVPPPAPPAPPKAMPGSTLFVSHEVHEQPAPPSTPEYVLAPGATKLSCVLETAINSDVEGYLTCRISTNVYDTATGRHLLIPQGSTILGHDQSQHLLYGNERLPTISLTLALPDGRSVDLGHAPITDQQGVAGLTGDVNNHWGRLFGAVIVGSALRGGVQALQAATAEAGGAGSAAAGAGAVTQQAVSPRLGRALDTRPTITVEAGQLATIILIKPLSLPAMWH